MLLVVGVVVAVGVGAVAWASSRATPTTGGSGGGQQNNQQPPPQPQQPAAVQLQPPQQEQQRDGAADLAGQLGIFGAIGQVAGGLAGGSAFTNVAKDLSVPVGLGVAGAAYLATTLGGAAVIGVGGVAAAGTAAAGYLAVPIILVTVAIITIVDGVTRATQADKWRTLVIGIRDLRAAGKVDEAWEAWNRAKAEISEIAQVWPQPQDDWYNRADPLGRPYPGFPGPPAPATLAEIAARPSLVPGTLTSKESGGTLDIAALLSKLEADVAEVRAWGLANRVRGKAVRGGAIVDTDTGPRFLMGGALRRAEDGATVADESGQGGGWKPLEDRIAGLEAWRRAIASAVPWVTPAYWSRNFDARTPEEHAYFRAVADLEAAKKQKVKDTRDAARIKAETGTKGKIPIGVIRAAQAAQAAEVQAEATARTQERVAGNAPRPAGQQQQAAGSETETARTGGRRPANNSGSGGRNA